MVQKKLPVILHSLNKVMVWVHSSPTDGAQGTLPGIRNKRLPSVLADFGSNTSTLLLPLRTTFFLKYSHWIYSAYTELLKRKLKIEYAFAFETWDLL